jgi:homoserine dehydrogenase
LSSLSFHTKIPFTKVYREGITDISVQDINYGKQFGYVLKLLAIGKNNDSGIEVRVHPTFIKSSHPLASVNDSYNAVYITGDCVEDVMLYGRGAGALPTGSAIVGDVIYCATHSNYQYSPFKNTEDAAPSTKFVTNFESAYYIRLNAKDKSGVLAKVSSIFSKCGISVAQMYQEEPNGNADGSVPIIFITHVTKENNVKKAIKEIDAIPETAQVAATIRVVS